jgi:glycolate oxidase FAD binding subunit
MSAPAVTDSVLVGFAREVGRDDPVAVEGGRTRWATGGPPAGTPRLVRAPTGIVAFRPAEMTVTVRAGTAVAELDAALAEAGQRCALPDRGGTVGGSVVVGENHLELLGRGRLRDAVLQVRYVSAQGELVTGGGPVVKNVSGYNLPKLLVGSLGTLGLVAEVVLRTNPVPAARRWLAADEVDPSAVRDALVRPGAVLWDGFTTWVLLEGHGPDLDAEAAVLAGLGGFREVAGPPALPPHRWSCRPATAAGFDRADRFVASVGVGTVWAATPPPPPAVDPGAAAISARVKNEFDPTGRLNPGRRAGD